MTDSTPRDLLIVFGSVQRVMRAERAAREGGLDVDAAPAPRSVSSECGVVLEARSSDSGALTDILDTLELVPKAVYRNQGGTWTPSTLRSTEAVNIVKLTEGSAYGGCGAKLSKGLLHTVLCGLPRLVVGRPHRRHRVGRRRRSDEGLRRTRHHPHDRFLSTHGGRPLHLRPNRRHKCPLRCLGHGRHSARRHEPRELSAQTARQGRPQGDSPRRARGHGRVGRGARRRPHRRGRRAPLRPRGDRHRPPRQASGATAARSPAMSWC